MPYVSHRSAEARTFDCLYDPNYIVPSDRDAVHASLSAADNAAPVHIYPKYEVMFENAPKEMRLIFRKQHSLPGTVTFADVLPAVDGNGDGNAANANANALAMAMADADANANMDVDVVERLAGGANLANLPTNRKLQKVIASAGECKSKSASSGLYLYRPCTTTDVSVINVRLSDSNAKVQPSGARLRARSTIDEQQQLEQCNNFQGDEGTQAKRKRIISKTRGTQTLYRESSAQTLPYLPDVSNDKEYLENLELFRLPTILPGDGPPGLYEVEVLERARKRWAFNKALKENFERQLKEARETAKRPEHKHILEAFEWEQWIEREEYIQECQMLRLELLIRMFDKREREMHVASKERLTKRCEQIEEKRKKALEKNEIEFGREMRRLEMRRRNVPRNWRKENICDQLGHPSSEFYAPQMRYGVNPNRRHFTGGRKAFEARMDDLEKQVIGMGKLVCPYAKLKAWSKPKEQAKEYEQNFCSDENLKKLYENMKHLRELQERTRSQPKCLIEKLANQKNVSQEQVIEPSEGEPSTTDVIDAIEIEKKKKDPLKEQRAQFEEIRREAEHRRQRLNFLLDEKRNEEMDAMMADYEGSTIGWLMRFLTEEMDRLQEQRKLHFITMMAQRERWRREAAEAGLRQKENNMRLIYEQLYQDTTTTTEEVAGEYLDQILRAEVDDYAEDTATESVLALARLIDEDIQRWLKSIREIQTPLNFDALRYLLKNLIFPNAEMLIHRYETEQVARYIINDVLFPRIECILEPFDIGVAIAEETIDRTIDTDLHYVTSQSECSTDCDLCPSEASCSCTPEKREAGALLRKLIRYVVPGRRWKTPEERIAYENVNDILDVAFNELVCKGHFNQVGDAPVTESPSHMNLINITPPHERATIFDSSSSSSELVHINILEMHKQSLFSTRELQEVERVSYVDPWRPSEESDVLQFQVFKKDDSNRYGYRQASAMKSVCSTIDLMLVADDYSQLERFDNISQRTSINSEDYMIDDTDVDETTKKYMTHLLNQMVKTAVPAEEGDSELSEFQVEEEHVQNEEHVHNEEDEIGIESSSEQFEDNPNGVIDYLLKKAIPSEDDTEYGFNEEYELEKINEEETDVAEEEDTFILEISESELEMIKDKDRCKCAEEKRRETYVRHMMQLNRVRIRPKEITPSVGMGSIVTFEYRSIESHTLLGNDQQQPTDEAQDNRVAGKDVAENYECIDIFYRPVENENEIPENNTVTDTREDNEKSPIEYSEAVISEQKDETDTQNANTYEQNEDNAAGSSATITDIEGKTQESTEKIAPDTIVEQEDETNLTETTDETVPMQTEVEIAADVSVVEPPSVSLVETVAEVNENLPNEDDIEPSETIEPPPTIESPPTIEATEQIETNNAEQNVETPNTESPPTIEATEQIETNNEEQNVETPTDLQPEAD